MGRHAGQKQAPGQDNRGQMNDCYQEETAVRGTQRVVSKHMLLLEEIYCRSVVSALRKTTSKTKSEPETQAFSDYFMEISAG